MAALLLVYAQHTSAYAVVYAQHTSAYDVVYAQHTSAYSKTPMTVLLLVYEALSY
jgi:hypothetical protein